MADATFTLRPIRPEDYPQVRSIYEMGLESGHATYETKAPTWEQFSRAKILETVFVAVDKEDPEKLLGWVAAAPISSRSVFHGVVENSIYIHPDAAGRGVAGALLDKLIEVSVPAQVGYPRVGVPGERGVGGAAQVPRLREGGHLPPPGEDDLR